MKEKVGVSLEGLEVELYPDKTIEDLKEMVRLHNEKETDKLSSQEE